MADIKDRHRDTAPRKLVPVTEVKVARSCLTLCDPMDYTGQNSPGQNTGVGSLSLLQGNLPNPGIKQDAKTNVTEAMFNMRKQHFLG